jgi:hypothetical protein
MPQIQTVGASLLAKAIKQTHPAKSLRYDWDSTG